jgi:signal-transduction protein with cAMP-binding, CBS, and nucleotidyltransferase domain
MPVILSPLAGRTTVQRRIVPHLLTGEQRPAVLPRAASVQDAVLMMYRQKIDAVMIVEEGRLLGIFTERDLARCTATHMDLDATPLGLVMTWKPKTVSPTETPIKALERMQEGSFRHLPVVDGSKLVGIVAMHDLFGALRREFDDEPTGCPGYLRNETYEAGQAAA